MSPAFESSYVFTHIQENGAADKYILSTLKGETAETFSGIYRAVHPQWAGWALIDAGDTSSQQLKDMVKEFYYRQFWLRMKLDQLPFPLSGLVFDFGVNSGRQLAVQKLQKILSTGADGDIGPRTVAAVSRMRAEKLVMAYIAARLDFLNDLKNWNINSRGWSQRIVEILRFAAQ